MTLKKCWKEEFNIVTVIRLILKAWQEITMKWLKSARRNFVSEYGDEETSDDVHKLVKDITQLTHDRNLEVE